jgi:methylenetetrahydrofolate reductase (NADPH)
MGREDHLLEVLPPLDWDKVGTEQWSGVWHRVQEIGTGKVIKGLLFKPPEVRYQTWDEIFHTIREPDWWQGDNQYHPPQYSEPVSELERKLKAGEFVVTAEVAPPVSCKTDKMCKHIEALKPYVAAINFTDNPSATPRTASWACSRMAIDRGAEPVMQIAARDRTRVGLQSEVMGAVDLGIRNILCISGDSMKMAPPPRGRMDVIDIDSIQMLWILRRMRDEGKYMDGREIKTPPQYFLGAAASPFASEPKFQALREHKKINAGAQFFQTNLVYDLVHMEIWLNELAKRDILDKVYILIGITPLKTLKMARYMNDEVPGVSIPEPLLGRMEAAEAAGNAQAEGIQIALELIDGIKKFTGQGVNGLHIMAVGWEDIVPRIVTEGGVLPSGFVQPEVQMEKAPA